MMTDHWKAGFSAAMAGVPWWENPCTGPANAEWDTGHTAARRRLAAGMPRFTPDWSNA